MIDFQLYKNHISIAIPIIIVLILLYNYQTKKIVKSMMKKELYKLKKQNVQQKHILPQEQESYMDPAEQQGQNEDGEVEESF